MDWVFGQRIGPKEVGVIALLTKQTPIPIEDHTSKAQTVQL